MADFFGQIAANNIAIRENMIEPKPEKFKKRKIELSSKTTAPIVYEKKISTKEELQNLLKIEREKYSKFLKEFSPKMQNLREKISLKNFILNGEKEITIPYYGGPAGVNRQVYETEFSLEKIDENKAYNICFKGVDYIAVVYVNGEFVGRHEGFFSPFFFDISSAVKQGVNKLKIEVDNDYVFMGNDHDYDGLARKEGDKLYAATGLGWDDPKIGWHHCPPGMGIYNEVYVEITNKLFITDVFVRPLIHESKAEVWVETNNTFPTTLFMPTLSISVYGKNFEETVFENLEFETTTDRLEEGGFLNEKGKTGKIKLYMKKGINVYKTVIDIPNFKLWSLTEPNLYEVQVSLKNEDKLEDTFKRQFGMRSFVQDYVSKKKGMFYLNGNPIRLRGANTMGFEQQEVKDGNINQLIDDILYAKLCNMNFLRLTQRPVQDEIYEYCDKLGLMTQTDLPLFACMRLTKFAEGVRQAEEMEKLVRSHPCNVIISYINEPSPYAYNEPQRHLMRPDLENFFKSCDAVVKLNNPDRVIKYVDGDYDPPSDMIPDNHCYNMWYIGHNLDFGKMLKGYWCPVKPNWYYGCGEFGVEGLDYVDLMKRRYPKEWLEEPFNPQNIVRAQSGNFYQFFYNKPETLEEWVSVSQNYQASSMKTMTEVFRRNNDMVTFAIHLFIDAWPSGWMKTIMDCERTPKPAYFAYRNALAPLMVSFRTDRYTYYLDEEIKLESYLSNDTLTEKTYDIRYEVYNSKGELVKEKQVKVKSQKNKTVYIGSPSFKIDSVSDREKFNVKVFLIDNGKVIDYNEETIEIFERTKTVPKSDRIVWLENLPEGENTVAGETFIVINYWRSIFFARVNKNDDVVNKFDMNDFYNWYDKKEDCIMPVSDQKYQVTTDGFKPILYGASGGWCGLDNSLKEYAVMYKEYEGKIYIVNGMNLREENPIAKRFKDYLNERFK